MIRNKHELKEVIDYEYNQYCHYMFPSRRRRFMGYIKHEPIMRIMKWQRLSRKVDYYKYRIESCNATFIEKIAYMYYITRRNHLGERLGIEVETYNVGKGLLIYHYSGGITLSNAVKIGINCHLHGNNCIGNSGLNDRCPVLGDNIMVGVGAKIIGNVEIVDNVKIAAGAIVVKDIIEPGCTVAGVPAKIVKQVRNSNEK